MSLRAKPKQTFCFLTSKGVVKLKFVCPTHSEAKQTEMSEFGAEKGLLQGPCKENRWLMLKRPELPNGFQGRSFYMQNWGGGRCCRVCNPPLIGWWWGNRMVFQESQSSAFWFQPVWGPHACAQPKVILLHLGGGLSSCRRTQRYISNCYPHPPRRNQDHHPALLFSFCIPSLF